MRATLVGSESWTAGALGQRSNYDLAYLALARLGMPEVWDLDTGPACMPGVLNHSDSELGADYDLN